jgi:hypothetical protein
MDRMGGPMGRLLASLPLEQRAERYRQLAAATMRKARGMADADRRGKYLIMAIGWHALAVEAERSLGKVVPNEIAGSDQDEAAPNDTL